MTAFKRASRWYSRKKKGSNNRKEAALRLARMQARIAHVRKDTLHYERSHPAQPVEKSLHLSDDAQDLIEINRIPPPDAHHAQRPISPVLPPMQSATLARPLWAS